MNVWLAVVTRGGKFIRDLRGSVTAFTAVIFLMLVVGGGMAVDFMRHEAMRVELQDALDRGVLAAAGLDQSFDAEQTIRGYIRSTSLIGDDYILQVQDTGDAASRQITAAAELELRTYFLKIVGKPTLKIAAHGAAFESRQDIEISLVLDVSTSMSACEVGVLPCEVADMVWTGLSGKSRLEQMKDDAEHFVDIMVNERTSGYLTLSVVPFAGQVNPGQTAMNYVSNGAEHPYSYCVDFNDADFLTTTLPSGSREQTQYFSFSYYYGLPDLDPTIEYGWCPVGNAEQVVYHSDDADEIKAHIRGLRTHEGTGSQYGIKWATALLDPSSQPLTTRLVGTGDVHSDYADRPGAYENDRRLKFVVFMSDGNTTQQLRVQDYAYNSAVDRDWWATNIPGGGDGRFGYGDFVNPSTSVEAARDQFKGACSAAKEEGIVIFTIGFDIEDGKDAQADLRDCASSDSHFYDVDGVDLRDAFSAIASTIQKLKLIN